MNQSVDILSEEEDEVDGLDPMEQEEEEELSFEKSNMDEKEEEPEEMLDETESTKRYWLEQRQIDNFDFAFLDEDFFSRNPFSILDDAHPSYLFMNSASPKAPGSD